MTIRELFIDVIEREREDFLEMLDGYDLDEIVREASYIAKFEAIYKYLYVNEPLDDNQMEHLAKLNNPISMIANRYNSQESELHEEFMVVIDDVVNNKHFSFASSGSKVEELLKTMFDELGKMNGASKDVRDYKYIFEEMRAIAPNIAEYDAETLLQFTEPIKVIYDCMKGQGHVKKGFEDAVCNINNTDIYSMTYEINHDKVLEESKHRHNAMTEMVSLIPKPMLGITTSWISFYRDVMADNETENPYKEMLDAFKTIKEEHGEKMLQDLYELGKTFPVLYNEITEVAKYLADGGDINEVPDLAKEDKFLKPYEELKAELEQEDEQEQGGMDLC